MRDRRDRTRVRPETVGEDRPPETKHQGRVGGWFTMGVLTWTVVIVVALVFLAAILVAALSR
jgi:hypothetical protein